MVWDLSSRILILTVQPILPTFGGWAEVLTFERIREWPRYLHSVPCGQCDLCKHQQGTMGHIAHLRNAFLQSYTITFIKKEKNTFLRIGCFLFVKILIHFTQGFSCVVWLKLAQWFWRRFFKISMYFAISLLSPLGRWHWPFISLHPRMLCAKFDWN